MVKKVLTTLLKTYSHYISGLLPPRCRFHPTCSHYACQAIETHGVIKGVGLSVIRLSKCHPFHEGGLDPVPEPKVKPTSDSEPAEQAPKI